MDIHRRAGGVMLYHLQGAWCFLPGFNNHGTFIAGLIAAHRTLLGAAPRARILAARGIGPTGTDADILVAIPNGAFEMSSGNSLSAAEVSGVAALILESKPDLTPDQVRAILQSTARDLGPKGRDSLFAAGVVNAYAALLAEAPPVGAEAPRPVEGVSAGAQ